MDGRHDPVDGAEPVPAPAPVQPAQGAAPSENAVAAGLKFSGTVISEEGDGWNADVARLAVRHSPVFVLFPDAAKDPAKPYPSGQHDYHPRRVETYLDRAFLVSQAQATWARFGITLGVALGAAVIGTTLVVLALVL